MNAKKNIKNNSVMDGLNHQFVTKLFKLKRENSIITMNLLCEKHNKLI